MEKNELIKEAHEICEKCVFMLENAPQGMSNVGMILNVLTAANKLIEFFERES